MQLNACPEACVEKPGNSSIWIEPLLLSVSNVSLTVVSKICNTQVTLDLEDFVSSSYGLIIPAFVVRMSRIDICVAGSLCGPLRNIIALFRA